MGGAITIRQVTSMDKKLEVRDRMKRRYAFKNYPDEFSYRCKCIVVFQNLDGVDVILFGLYVYEHDEKNPSPNKRCVYVSYLDSVHYMRPRHMRTFIYHEILISYLDYVRKRGYSTAHIWACPPLKGDDYILYAKPEDQKTPKDERLRQWYIDMLVESQKRGVVGKVTNMYDLYFANKDNDATIVPYMDGDYFPAEAENIIKNIEEGKTGKKGSSQSQKKKKGDTSKKKKSGRGGTRSTGIDEEALKASGILDGKDQKSLEEGGRDYVMQKLGETIQPMKESFIVAFLAWEKAKEEDMVVPKEIQEYREKHGFVSKHGSTNKADEEEGMDKMDVDEAPANPISAAPDNPAETAPEESKEVVDELKEETKEERKEETKEKSDDEVKSDDAKEVKTDPVETKPSAPASTAAESENAPISNPGDLAESNAAEPGKLDEATGEKMDGNTSAPTLASSATTDQAAASGPTENAETTDTVPTASPVSETPALTSGVASATSSSATPTATMSNSSAGAPADAPDAPESKTTSSPTAPASESGAVPTEISSADPVPVGSAPAPTSTPAPSSDAEKPKQLSLEERSGKFAAMARKRGRPEEEVKEVEEKKEEEPQTTTYVSDSKGRRVKVIDDDAEEMDCEFLNNRQAFLNLCQGNHYQYDMVRRAKHSSMMVLWHLHNRDAPKFVQQCTTCSREILQGYRYHCPTCADFDQCEECVRNPKAVRHPHPLKPIPVASGQQTELTEAQRKERQRSIQLHMTLLLHAATCKSAKCPSANCQKMKGLLKHGAQCQQKATGGCNVCKRIWALLQIHARQCKQSACPVPNCMAIRERVRQLKLQQQAMDDRRRQQMNSAYRMGAR